ncbi:putative linoleate 13S-lipoxygenase [Helianthus debilis subsp. tardiflorus]
MLNPRPIPSLLTLRKKAFITGDNRTGYDCGSPTFFLSPNTLAFPFKPHKNAHSQCHIGNSSGQIKAVANESRTTTVITTINLKVVVTVRLTVGGVLSNLSLTRALDDINDLLGKSLLLELVAAEIDPGYLVPLAETLRNLQNHCERSVTKKHVFL